VLCVPETPQIQAVEGTTPVLPMRPGQAERRSHDYRRHGTTDLFAALNVKTGSVIGAYTRRHRGEEFHAFLDQVEASVPADLDVYLVLDNASSHKTRLVHDWLVKRSRWHLHFTPPAPLGSISWRAGSLFRPGAVSEAASLSAPIACKPQSRPTLNIQAVIPNRSFARNPLTRSSSA
jgi:transposase